MPANWYASRLNDIKSQRRRPGVSFGRNRADRGPGDGAGCPPSLFKLIRGIVRETDSRRPMRAQHMKSHAQAIESRR
jgi:hypothetical protein